MAKVLFQGNPIMTYGNMPLKGERAREFSLIKSDLSEITLDDFKGRMIVLNIFPSIDTSVCAASVRKFNEIVSKLDNTVVLCVSMDLPFAHKRFCAAEGLQNVITASAFRNPEFGKNYGCLITENPFKGLFARAVAVIDTEQIIRMAEFVPEIGHEPNYQDVINVVNKYLKKA